MLRVLDEKPLKATSLTFGVSRDEKPLEGFEPSTYCSLDTRNVPSVVIYEAVALLRFAQTLRTRSTVEPQRHYGNEKGSVF